MSDSSYANARIIHHATSVLCNNKGSMVLLQLHMNVFQRFDITEDELWCIVKKCPRFVIVKNEEEWTGEWGANCTVVAKTSLRLCKMYRKQDCSHCQELHLCKYFVYGNCRHGKGRTPCKFSHDIRSEHNYPILRECTLHELSEDDLFLLLLQNDPTLLPEVCSDYNKGTGPHGACTFMDNCTKLHLCMHFLKGRCEFGLKCKRQHVVRMLEERGLGGDVVRDLPFIYQNIHYLAKPTLKESMCAPVHMRDEICLNFLQMICIRQVCMRMHTTLPYQWEVFDGSCWRDLRNSEQIERAFCDPCKTQSTGARPIDFLTMTRELDPIRRLSTVSSVTKSGNIILTTQWLWYYKGDHENWSEYGRPDDKLCTTSLTSQDLEKAYMADRTAEVTVVKRRREYHLSFHDMYQRNTKHNTKKKVRRRPNFISASDMEKKIKQKAKSFCKF